MRSVLPKATVLSALLCACATEQTDPNATCDPSILVCQLGVGGSARGSGGSDPAGSGGDSSAAGTFGTFSGGASGTTGSGGLFGTGGGFGSGGGSGSGGDGGAGASAGAGSSGSGGVSGASAAGGSAGTGASAGAAGKGGAAGGGGAPIGNCPARPWTATSSQFSNVCDPDPTYGLCNPPSYAVDTDPSSRFSTGKPQAGDEWLQVDFGVAVTLTQVSFFTSNAGDYGRHLEIRISDDPLEHDAPLVWEADGAASLTANFDATTGRYLLVSQTGTLMMGQSAWWSLHTLDVVCQ